MLITHGLIWSVLYQKFQCRISIVACILFTFTDVPAPPASLNITESLENVYVISWSSVTTADPNHYYTVRTPNGTFDTNDTELRVPKSVCSVACGDCVYQVRGVSVVRAGLFATVSLSSEGRGSYL